MKFLLGSILTLACFVSFTQVQASTDCSLDISPILDHSRMSDDDKTQAYDALERKGYQLVPEGPTRFTYKEKITTTGKGESLLTQHRAWSGCFYYSKEADLLLIDNDNKVRKVVNGKLTEVVTVYDQKHIPHYKTEDVCSGYPEISARWKANEQKLRLKAIKSLKSCK